MSKDDYILGLWGIVMHLTILWGVLDVNFHSPIIRDLSPVPPVEGPPAKRLFLFIADGLRYRTFAESTPFFLGNIKRNEGVWGISHTRVPTESRPGNVAIMAGVYEDPSALFKGWKENPVDFDSTFNRSTESWAWGSPDIVPMFVKGSHGNIHGATYPHDWQDFDKESNSPRQLDEWVFNKYKSWLKNDAENVRNQSGIIVFFHLLGCDTAGHGSKPASREYQSQMQFVDTEIAEVMKQTEAFFGDKLTSYIFTADHGMTDWGSHGDGSPDETETPFVAWGAGIDQMNLRQDINQADIAPLISTLLGISIPTNSEGLLPRSFLKKSNEQFGLIAVLNNIKQLIIQIKATRIFTIGDTPSLSEKREQELAASVNRIETFQRENKITEALKEADSVIVQSKETLYYYRRLQRNQLIFYLTLLWIGWIALMIFKLFGTQHQPVRTSNNNNLYLTLLNAAFCIVVILLIIEHKVSGRGDWRVLGYGTISFFSIFLGLRKALSNSLHFRTTKNVHWKIATASMILLIMSISAGVIDKRFFSIAMIIAALMQYKLMQKPHRFLVPSALLLAVYPLLPAPKPNVDLIMIVAAFIITPWLLPRPSRGLITLELARVFLTGLIMSGVIDGRTGASWLILISSPLSILLYPTQPAELKLTGVIFALLCPLALLSASYEPQVFCLLGVHLISLLKTIDNANEQLDIMKPIKTSLDLKDMITAVYFMLYILLSFFGTGNMASISSFDPMWTRHFITIFSPFTMTTLILLKLGIPLILIGCASHFVISSSTFLAVLLLGDLLSLPLMFNVSSQGSWLYIGTTISRYSISITLPCLFIILYYISSPLMSFRITRHSKIRFEKDHLI